MKILRYKTMSQQIDSENLYNNLTILSELFMLGNDYFVFLKRKDSNEIVMVKESFAGGFDVIKIPLSTWGVTVNQQTMLKCYTFEKVNVNLFSFKINSQQYLTIIENNDGQTAVFVDSTDDTKAVKLIESCCPLAVTSQSGNWTVFSYDNSTAGVGSAVLYSTDVTWDDWTGELHPIKIDSILSSMDYDAGVFAALISDTASTNMYWIYTVAGGVATASLPNSASFQNALLNQVTRHDATTLVTPINATSLSAYINLGFTADQILVFRSNTSLIFVDSSSNYIYKNILKYFTSTDFSYTAAFDQPALKFNLLKQILYSVSGVTDLSNLSISRLVIDSNMFTKVESNIAVVTPFMHKESGLWLADAQSMYETLTPSDVPMTSSIIQENMGWD